MRLKSLSWIFIPFLMAVLRANGMARIATTQETAKAALLNIGNIRRANAAGLQRNQQPVM